MNRDDTIRLAREAGLSVGTNISAITLVGAPSEYGLAHITIEEMERFAALIAEAEREACCSIVFGQCESDNVAQRTVDAIKARGRWVKTYSGGVPNYTTGEK
jgi:hypothetical protein